MQSQSILEDNTTARPTKSIAIVGGGTAGIAVLKTILDIPAQERVGWDFVLFEQRRDVGGVWLPDPRTPHPPDLPETPLYPTLRTNTPVPSMTYKGVPYSPSTPLYPNHVHVEAYLRNVSLHFGLEQYVRRGHEVVSASWVGDSSKGFWNTTVRDKNAESTLVRQFDHIVNAAGNYHYPRSPVWEGQKTWLQGSRRRIVHSIYYRGPEEFRGQRVLIVGSGASGRDAAIQLLTTASKLYIVIRSENTRDPDGIPAEVPRYPSISHFSRDAVHFVDGSSVEVDTVLLGTGYHYHIPYLSAGGSLKIDDAAREWTEETPLTTNLRYIFPLHEHVLSLDAAYPLGALTFVGLPQYIANSPSDNAQAIFITALFRNASILPPRAELLAQSRAREGRLRDGGWDPYVVGHRLVDGSQYDYQDALIAFLRRTGALPKSDAEYVEAWRREVSDFQYLRRGWLHVEELGEQEKWLEGVQGEEEWADLMRRLNAWQREWEESHNVPFRWDADLI
ncbi:FAD/NAD(P)-binding domain-containing protein [Auricularia subglabra TFB-10046 SS5]|nr:FAD/NAD(P)-binding domain-containing protein [Auricularia subglabra TFB-10046 SS5]